jgi:hypothetical protein
MDEANTLARCPHVALTVSCVHPHDHMRSTPHAARAVPTHHEWFARYVPPTPCTQYSGGWRDDLPHGEGRCRWAAGHQAAPATAAAEAEAAAAAAAAGGAKGGRSRGGGALPGDPGAAGGGGPSGEFEGQWVRGVRQGQGRMAWANGDWYEGRWAGDVPEGQGGQNIRAGLLLNPALVWVSHVLALLFQP